MHPTSSLLDGWIQENNELVNTLRVVCYSFSCLHFSMFLLAGIPPCADHTQLELTVVYNACVCSTSQSCFSEAELLLVQATEREGDHDASDHLGLWKSILKSAGSIALKSCVLHLLCLQWAIWLATCQLKTINEFKVRCCTLCAGVGGDRRSDTGRESSDTPLLLMDPRQLSELLQICTFIAQGHEGQSTEALTGLQTASFLPAPRTLVAYTHLLSGSCLAHMARPQMALQCFRKALETDSRCVSALYQSMLIYRQLGNTQAEIQALHLLHSVSYTNSPGNVKKIIFLLFQSLNSLLSLFIIFLHTTTVKTLTTIIGILCAVCQSQVHVEVLPLPRLPKLYLEAGSALLMALRPSDCMALCDEVISSTLELLPEKVVLEEQEQKYDAETRGGPEGEDRVEMMLWAGAAYLLQGHCYTHLKDWKQAVTHYTRCYTSNSSYFNFVHLCMWCSITGFPPQIPSADMVCKQRTDLCTLQRLKGLSIAGRGISFTQTDQLKEALRDLQLSLQALPGTAGLWCGEVLWRLGRRSEAAACWEKTWSQTTLSSET
uniref:FA complementation group G n=1 Tax=Labrus bergylta TaxID=56723 RepID=A0A3Q3MH85_9LABR